MSLDDRLLAAIRRGKQEKEQEERDRREFENRWEDLRRSIVAPVCRAAVKHLGDEQVGGSANPGNGGYVLEAGWQSTGQRDAGHFLHRLSFHASREARRVIIESPFKEQPEPFDLESLTQEVVEREVEEFVHAVSRGKKGGEDQQRTWHLA